MEVQPIEVLKKSSKNLKSHEQICAMLLVKTIICEILTSILDLQEFLRRTELRIKFPYLSSTMIVGSSEPGISSFSDLQLPHCDLSIGLCSTSLPKSAVNNGISMALTKLKDFGVYIGKSMQRWDLIMMKLLKIHLVCGFCGDFDVSMTFLWCWIRKRKIQV